MKILHISTIIASLFFILFLTSHVYAQCTIVNGKSTCIGMQLTQISSIKSDMLVYVNSDKPVITITGVPNELESLEIDDHSGNVIFYHNIELPPTGVLNYTLDISSYKHDIYSANVNTSTGKITTSFAVGLEPSGERIDLISSKLTYVPNETIQIMGFWNPNTMINLDLVDPTNQIKNSAMLQSDSVGNFTKKFVVPSNAINGTWQVRVTSGLVHTTLNIFVISQNLQQNQPVQNVHVLEKNMTLSKHPAHVFSMQDSPLKQFKSGIAANDVQCRQDLQLVIKTEDNSPACAKLDAAYMLIKRGWAVSESAYPGGDAQFALYTNSTIIPAHLPYSSGLRVPYYESSRVINYSGFDGMYNETFPYRGTQKDYVLKPGSTGVITFKLDAVASEQQGQDYSIPLPKSLNLTNYAIFYHEITSLEDLSKYPGVTFDGNDYGHFRACSTGPAGGGTCIGGPFGGTNPIEAFVTDHPGVDVLFEPPSEVLPLGMNTTSQVVTMMITADSNAPRGTYLVELPSIGLDSFLLTVGDRPYPE